MRRVAIPRIAGLLIAIIGVGVAIKSGRDAQRLDAEFHQWLDARPMQCVIDLSQPGETTVPFHQTCSVSHGEALYFECELDDKSKRNTEELLKGLSAAVVIEDSNGNLILSAEIDNTTAVFWDQQLKLASLEPFGRGDYVAKINVDSGAPALAGKPQNISAKYQLCGLERMPAVIAGALAFAAGITGLVSTLFVVPSLLKFGIWQAVAKRSFEQDDAPR